MSNKTLTKEQQSEIAEQLQSLFGSVYLRCDGYLVSAYFERITATTLGINVFVNGHIDGAWFDYKNPTQEVVRFYRPITIATHKPSEIKRLEKEFGKRFCKKHGDIYKKISMYSGRWIRPKPFIRHILKQNKSVELLNYDQYEVALVDHKKTIAIADYKKKENSNES